MIDGELKKRLEQIIFKYGETFGGRPIFTIDPDSLGLVLDAIKKEFPKTPKNCIEDISYPEEVRFWFNKWFGASNNHVREG